MNLDLARPALSLDRDAIARLDHARGHRVLCTYGALWITLDEDSRDILLESGDTFEIDSDARVLVSALRPSSLVVLEPRGTLH